MYGNPPTDSRQCDSGIEQNSRLLWKWAMHSGSEGNVCLLNVIRGISSWFLIFIVIIPTVAHIIMHGIRKCEHVK